MAKSEQTARRKYRQSADDSYEPLPELRKIISHADKLASLKNQLGKFSSVIDTATSKEASAKAVLTIREVEKALGAVAGVSSIKSKISRARRALRKRKPDLKKARRELESGLKIYATEVAWRKRAAKEMLPGLITYDTAIKNNIGLRLQVRLTSEQAAEIAICKSVHRDISLAF